MKVNPSPPSKREQDNGGEEEQLKQETNGPVRSGRTTSSTWIAVFGSSTVFHVLMLILLGMIIISQPENPRTEVPIRLMEKQENVRKDITETKVDTEVQKETRETNPMADTNESINEVNARTRVETDQNLQSSPEAPTKNPSARSITLDRGGGDNPYGRADGPGGIGRKNEMSTPERQAVKAALIWLARHQNDDGYWELDQYDEQCPPGNKCESHKLKFKQGTNDVGATGLALLAFLGAGYTQESSTKLDGIDVGRIVFSALRWLKQRQKSNGAFDTGKKQIYNHAIAAMAYAEAYGMSDDPKLKGIAQKAIDFLENAQNTAGGERLAWRYRANSGDNDTSVTGWAAMALKSAKLAGLNTSGKAMQGAMRYVEQNTNERSLTGYASTISSRSDAVHHRAMTPVGMLIRMFAEEELDRNQVKRLSRGAQFAVAHLPEYQGDAQFTGDRSPGDMDYYYWYYASLSLYMFAGPGTKFEDTGYWQKWNRPMKNAVLSGQQSAREGHEVGSWDPLSRWGIYGGRVYVTALNALTLEVYYRYDNALFQ